MSHQRSQGLEIALRARARAPGMHKYQFVWAYRARAARNSWNSPRSPAQRAVRQSWQDGVTDCQLRMGPDRALGDFSVTCLKMSRFLLSTTVIQVIIGSAVPGGARGAGWPRRAPNDRGNERESGGAPLSQWCLHDPVGHGEATISRRSKVGRGRSARARSVLAIVVAHVGLLLGILGAACRPA